MLCLLFVIQSELLSTPRLTVVEGSVEELLVSEPNPEEPGHHRVTGIRLGRRRIRADNVHLLSHYYHDGSSICIFLSLLIKINKSFYMSLLNSKY